MTTMLPEEKMEIIEKYGECRIVHRETRPFSDTGCLYEYEITVQSDGGSIYRTSETHNNAVDRMYSYLKLLMAEKIRML